MKSAHDKPLHPAVLLSPTVEPSFTPFGLDVRGKVFKNEEKKIPIARLCFCSHRRRLLNRVLCGVIVLVFFEQLHPLHAVATAELTCVWDGHIVRWRTAINIQLRKRRIYRADSESDARTRAGNRSPACARASSRFQSAANQFEDSGTWCGKSPEPTWRSGDNAGGG